MYYSLKIFDRSTVIRHNQFQSLCQEKLILSVVRHPGIAKMLGSFANEHCIYLLTEFIPGGDLFNVLLKRQRFIQEIAKFYIAEVILLLEYLHEMGIVYRNIKPEDLFIDANGHIRLGEFSFSKFTNGRTFTTCGTPDYMAPEILNGTGHSFQVDFWAVGILLYEVLTGFPPFPEAPNLVSRDPNTIFYPPYLSGEAIDLIRKLLVTQPEYRIGFNGTLDIKLHPFFSSHPPVNWNMLNHWTGTGPLQPPNLQNPSENYPVREGFDLPEEYIVQMFDDTQVPSSPEIETFFQHSKIAFSSW